MADAANIAGQAFANAFVGVNHALAHSVGARFHLAHGRANAIFLPHVVRYNAALPMKFMTGPGTSSYVVPDKYAQLGRVLFGGHGPEDSRTWLFRAVDGLLDELHLPRTLKEAGVGEDEFLAALPDLAHSLCRLQHAHQSADAAHRGADRPATGRLLRLPECVFVADGTLLRRSLGRSCSQLSHWAHPRSLIFVDQRARCRLGPGGERPGLAPPTSCWPPPSGYDRRQGLLGSTRRKSLVRWIGVNPGPG
jgi:hypothetical protein